MIDYGVAPESQEIEVTLFGPGFGECIAIHLGDGSWVLVDSCINPDTKNPASLEYLDSIGVNNDQVKALVASHWHDDHVRGISKLSSKYSDAYFIISSVFNNKEALSFLTAFNGESSMNLSRGTKELYSAVKDRANVFHAQNRTIVFEDEIDGQPVMVTALSPVSDAVSKSIARFAEYLPQRGDDMKNAPELPPNLEAVVLHLKIGDDAILLGTDMENHDSLGWSAILSDAWSSSRSLASVYKVSHHGSKTGDNEDTWRKLLQPEAFACLTPWVLAGNRLPTNTDIERLKKSTPNAYITSKASNRPNMDSSQLKRLGDVASNIKLVSSGFGAIRLRRMSGESSWNIELFGNAQKL